jgi:hypothetical protein
VNYGTVMKANGGRLSRFQSRHSDVTLGIYSPDNQIPSENQSQAISPVLAAKMLQ